MADIFFCKKRVAGSGPHTPENRGQTFQKRRANDGRQGAHFLNKGFYPNECNRNDLKQEESGKFEPKQQPLEHGNEKGTFWTVCPYCYYMYEYESKYEECCLLCQNCRRGFQGLAVAAPPESSLVKEEGSGAVCYSGYGFFPLGCSEDSFVGDKKEVGGANAGKMPAVVEISDDSEDDDDDEKKESDVKNDVGKVTEEISNNGERRGAMKKVKSVARTTKKMMGRGIRGKKIENVPEFNEESEDGDGNGDSGSDGNVGCNEEDLEFFEGADDIYVDLKDID